MLDPNRCFDLEGRVAVVTGASSGLGQRFARLLAAAGAEVVGAARRLDRLEILAGEDNIEVAACDVTRAEDRERLIGETVARRGRVDILVNNAGIGGANTPAELEEVDDFRQVVDVNLVSLFAMAQLAGLQMLAQGAGSIINIASIFGVVGSAPLAQAGYCASKGGVVTLTRELGGEWARRGVRVNAIAPGFFPTEMTQPAFDDDRSMKWIRQKTPLGRSGRSHELDGALLFLASDASSYVIGQTIAVDGGWTAV